MASGGDAVDDNDLAKVEEEIEKSFNTSWENLPPPVFSSLFSKMGRSFVYTARQVCPAWLTNTEHEIGLRVKIDDSLPGNVPFIQSVKAVQARIIKWVEPSSPTFLRSLLRYPDCLKKLTISGSVQPQWHLRELQQFSNLSHLVLRGKALHAQDLTGTPLPANPDFPDLSVYETYEPAQENPPILLKKLKKLEIVMNEFSYPSVLPLAVRLNEPERAMEHDGYLKRLYFTVVNNVGYCLSNIRSPHLQSAQIFVYPKAGVTPPPNLNWRYLPLERFLFNHRRSLKDLYLPDFEGKYDNSEVDLSLFPTQLRKIQITLSRYIGDSEEAREQNLRYWKQVLSEQTQLEDIYLIVSNIPPEWVTDCLSSLTFGSKETLTYVDFVIDQEEVTVQLNLEIFAFCHKLEVLKLSGKETEIILRNFSKLPQSLKKVYVNQAMIELPDGNSIERFTKLEMLELKSIAISGGGNDSLNRQSRTLTLIRELLKLRKLCLLSLAFDSPLNQIPGMLDVLSYLDVHFDPTFPIFTLKLNLSYEMEAGWSEEIFDEDRLDIEYINSREPEEYTSWHSRHRNAISVDDEDHRIFIFQSLPFLLDIRARRQMGIVDDWDDDVEPVAIHEDLDSDDFPDSPSSPNPPPGSNNSGSGTSMA